MLLLIEDDAIARTAMAESLRSSGQQLLEAANAEQALAFLRDSPVELVLIDLVLPIVGGLKFMDLIHERRPNLPIIIISGYMSQRIGDAILATTGVPRSKFFTKPISPSDLVRTVQELLGSV
jgi:CheY-like chemotaxis protein